MARFNKICLAGMLLLSACMPMFACTPPPANLKVQLYYIPDERGKQAYNQIVLFSIALRGAGILDPDGQKTQFAPGDTNSVLPEVKCDTDNKGKIQIEVEVSGYSSDEATRPSHSGRQVVFHPCGRPLDIPVFISPVNAFSPLTEYVGLQDEVSRVAQSDERIAGQQVISLPDGRVLFTGGAEFSDAGKLLGVSNATAIFNPDIGAFTEGPKMSSPRAFHSITILDNRVILTGGLRQAGGTLEAVDDVDFFDLQADGTLKRVDGPKLNEARAFHTATVTPQNKNLLIYGGLKWDGSKPEAEQLQSAGSWEMLSVDGDGRNLDQGVLTGVQLRGMHTTNLLPNGKILVVGGLHADGGNVDALDSILELKLKADEEGVEISVSTDTLKEKRAAHTATLLSNDQLLVVGGMVPENNIFQPKKVLESMDLFSEYGSLNSNFSVKLRTPRVFHSTHRLEDGRILVFGGLSAPKDMAKKAEIFQPSSAAGEGIQDNPLQVEHLKNRFFHSGTVLLNGSLLIFGGATLNESGGDPYVTLNKGELFNPGPIGTSTGN